ncbi:phage tail protein [Kribbella sp. NPDC055110]
MTSAYLRYLPPVLWDHDDGGTVDLLVGVAEEMLSRANLGVRPVHVPEPSGLPAHTHGGLEGRIDRLHEMLDPRIAPERFLPWLAGWVGLEVPPLWGELQRRQAIAKMTGVWRRRGSADGLRRFLELHTVAAVRPRITVDDGTSVFRTTLAPGRIADVQALLCQGPTLDATGVTVVSGAAHPFCIGATPQGDLLLGDNGLTKQSAGRPPAVWRITRSGEYRDIAGAPPKPVPLPLIDPSAPPPAEGSPPPPRLGRPGGLVVDTVAGGWTAYVLDSFALYRISSNQLDQLSEVATAQVLKQGNLPEVMVSDGPGRLLIVNRDTRTIIEVNAGVTPIVLKRHVLNSTDVNPRAVVAVGRDLVVADARKDSSAVPADLIWVNRADPDQWAERRLLADAVNNPLVSPMAMLADGDDLLVLDAGVRPVAPPATVPFNRVRAEPAAVYRVRLDRREPVKVTGIERVTEAGRMCLPRGMVKVGDDLFVCDSGEPESGAAPPMLRGLPYQFGVFVHFPTQSTTQDGQGPVIRSIADLVNRQKPASSAAWLNWKLINPS